MSAAVPAPCHAVAIGAARGAVAHPTATLVAAILGSSVAFVDGSVVTVALPTLERAFAGSLADAQWIVNAYLLPLGALVLLGGASGDRFGRRRMFLIGLVSFTIASVLCASAPSLGVFLAARALQGAGAALLIPNSLALLGAFSGEARGRAIGTWAAAGAIAGALGPVVGGWLVDHVGWRAIFLLNVPIAAAAVWLSVTYVAESRDDAAVPTLDWSGAALATAGLAALTWGLTVLPDGGGDARATLALAVGMLALVAFGVVEWRRGDDAMMPLTLFSRRTFVGVTLLTLLLYAALAALLVLLPFVLMRVGRYGATAAGAAILPLPLAVGLASRAVGRWSERLGPRRLLTGGPLVVALGFALALRVRGDEVAYWQTVLPALLAISCGMAITVAPLTATVMAAVDAHHAGAASGVNNAVARIGGLIATASIGLLLSGADTSADIVSGFRAAALVSALLAVVAAGSAFVAVDPALRAGQAA